MGKLGSIYLPATYTGAKLLTGPFPKWTLGASPVNTGPSSGNVWGTPYTKNVYGFFYIDIFSLTGNLDTNNYTPSTGDSVSFDFTVNGQSYSSVMSYAAQTFLGTSGSLAGATFNTNVGVASSNTGFSGPSFCVNGFAGPPTPGGITFSLTQPVVTNGTAMATNNLGITQWAPPSSSDIAFSAPTATGFFNTLLTNGLYSWNPIFQMIGHD